MAGRAPTSCWRQTSKSMRSGRGDRKPAAGGQARARRQAARRWQALHDQVVKAGGLHIIGRAPRVAPNRHQLRGRSGARATRAARASTCRSGPLLRIFAGERITASCDAEDARRRGNRAPHGERLDRERRQRRSKPELRHPQQLLEYDDVTTTSADHLRPEERSARVERRIVAHHGLAAAAC